MLYPRVAQHARLDILVCNAAPALRPLGLSVDELARFQDFAATSLALVAAPLAALLEPLSEQSGCCVLVSSSALACPSCRLAALHRCEVRGGGLDPLGRDRSRARPLPGGAAAAHAHRSDEHARWASGCHGARTGRSRDPAAVVGSFGRPGRRARVVRGLAGARDRRPATRLVAARCRHAGRSPAREWRRGSGAADVRSTDYPRLQATFAEASR